MADVITTNKEMAMTNLNRNENRMGVMVV